MITKIGNAGSSSSGVVQFSATIKLVNADDSVKPGFSAMISIVTNKAEDVLMVPSMALMTDNSGKSYVLMAVNGKMSPVSVEAGLISDEYTELKSENLKEGDTLYVLLNLIQCGYGQQQGHVWHNGWIWRWRGTTTSKSA